jgi:hypothetical protein
VRIIFFFVGQILMVQRFTDVVLTFGNHSSWSGSGSDYDATTATYIQFFKGGTWEP